MSEDGRNVDSKKRPLHDVEMTVRRETKRRFVEKQPAVFGPCLKTVPTQQGNLNCKDFIQ